MNVCVYLCVCSLTVSWSVLVVYVVDEEGEKVEGQTHLSEKLFSKFNKQFLISTNLPVFLHHNLETISLRKIDMLCPEIQFWRMISAGARHEPALCEEHGIHDVQLLKLSCD